uniref:anthocyanidin 3-O-glucosyltransferase n=1 Tax=Salix viminalis TaxID=40686 RepID=A0A6N2K0N2_SALVM
MKKAEVVLIPIPAMGHIVALVEVAKLLVQRDGRLTTTVIIMHPALDPSTTKYTESLTASALPDRMRVVNLPSLESETEDAKGRNWLTSMIEGHKPHVREYVSNMRTRSQLSPDSPQLAGFIFDTFVTGMKEVADGLGVPWYVFSASEIPGLANPLPAKLAPSMVFKEDMLTIFLEHARVLKEARGILVNTYLEFESHALHSLSNGGKNPPVYPVGPMVKHGGDGRDLRSDESDNNRDIMEWLDDQPPLSVMFLCFGSWGSFSGAQVKEIARALEHCGHRFLWSLRKPSSQKGKIESPSDYLNFQEILPEGFLDRTVEIGKVIGWAPQVEILAHPAVGGFASHCGWNSILESVRFGVPVATWPLYAEQQLNAFQMVIDLGLAVEIKIDYWRDFLGDNEIIVSGDDIEKAIKHVMEEDSEVRKKVKEMSRISEKSLRNGGSSFSSLGQGGGGGGYSGGTGGYGGGCDRGGGSDGGSWRD